MPASVHRRGSSDCTHIEPLRLQGSINFLFLGLVVTAVALVPAPWRLLLMLAATGGALLLGAPAVRRANQFTYAPMMRWRSCFWVSFSPWSRRWDF